MLTSSVNISQTSYAQQLQHIAQSTSLQLHDILTGTASCLTQQSKHSWTIRSSSNLQSLTCSSVQPHIMQRCKTTCDLRWPDLLHPTNSKNRLSKKAQMIIHCIVSPSLIAERRSTHTGRNAVNTSQLVQKKIVISPCRQEDSRAQRQQNSNFALKRREGHRAGPHTASHTVERPRPTAERKTPQWQ
jgi:apolipoprotein N-acyltransferase